MEVDAVVKLGGSLIRDGVIDENMQTLTDLKDEHNIVVVIGGGELADGVRSFSSEYEISASTAHWTAIKCMELNTEMINDLEDSTEIVNSVDQVSKAFQDEKIVLMKTEKFMKSLEHDQSWELTSDSISGLLAEKLGADRLVIATDVDGIYSDDKLITEMSAEESLNYGNTCIDGQLPGIMKENDISCTVVSGKKSRRLEKAVAGEKVKGTHIE
jgi:aspartokinase-like uncharacterized kinase